MNYNQASLNNTENPLFELHKTDYNNYSDLSHFVDEYNKAQELIKECNSFYRSFLRSKLHTYKELTDNIYKREQNKFYKLSVFAYDKNKGPLADRLSYKTVAADFGVDISHLGQFNYDTPEDGSKIMRICEFLAGIKLQKECEENPNCKVILTLRIWSSFITPAFVMYKKNKNIIYDFYGTLHANISSINDLKAIGYSTEKQAADETYKITKKLTERWHELQKEYLPQVIEYVKNKKVIGVKINYEIANIAYQYLGKKNKKVLNEIEQAVWKHLYKDICLTEYCSYETIYNAYLWQLSKSTGAWSTEPVPSIIIKEIESNINKIEEDLYPEISDIIHLCQQAIVSSDITIENDNLYIIDANHTAQLFCKVNDLNNVDISIEGRHLICYIKFDNIENPYIGYKIKHNIICKTLVFNVDTNELEDYKIHHDNYIESSK